MQTQQDLYRTIQFVLDKAGRGAATPKECAIALSVAQNDLFQYYAYQCPGDLMNAGGGYGYGASDRATLALQPFYEVFSLSRPINTISVMAPSDMGVFLECISPTGETCKEYLPTEWNDAIRSVIYAKEWKVMQRGSTIAVHPTQPAVTSIEVHYLRTPKDILFSATTTGRVITIDNTAVPGTSQLPEFKVSEWPELLRRAMLYLGLNLSSADIISYGLIAAGITTPKAATTTTKA